MSFRAWLTNLLISIVILSSAVILVLLSMFQNPKMRAMHPRTRCGSWQSGFTSAAIHVQADSQPKISNGLALFCVRAASCSNTQSALVMVNPISYLVDNQFLAPTYEKEDSKQSCKSASTFPCASKQGHDCFLSYKRSRAMPMPLGSLGLTFLCSSKSGFRFLVLG